MSLLKSNFIIFLSFFLILSGCKKGELFKKSPVTPIDVTMSSIVDYNQNLVQFLIEGEIVDTNIIPLSKIKFYSDSKCIGNVLGEILTRDFQEKGVILELSPRQSFDIYITTEGNSECVKLTHYDSIAIAPASPQFLRTAPESPTRDTTNPGIFGTVFPKSSTLRFYKNSSCSQLIGLGTGIAFETTGIGLNVDSNQTTEIFATTQDGFNTISNCTKIANFIHSTSTLSDPVLISINEPSPNSITSNVIIKGIVDAASDSVSLYSDTSCSVNLVSGSPNVFSTSGFPVSMKNNATTLVYAKSVSAQNVPSSCSYLTSFTHDSIAPTMPTFLSANPVSPTNLTLFPKMIGNASADTLTVKIYDSFLCLTPIGVGSANDFKTTGISSNITENTVNEIFAKSFDFAGNSSDCTYLTTYTHNTMPPAMPIFEGSSPSSPTNSTTIARFYGTPSDRTVLVKLFDDEYCTNLLASGSDSEFRSPGIQATLQENKVNSIYVKVQDFEGNSSECAFLTEFAHSNVPAASPGFTFSFPSSPSNVSSQPFIVGTTDSTITQVSIYDSNTCSNSIGTGSRAIFTSSGIQVTLPSNSTTNLYAIATDYYGNMSSCAFLTQYIHNNIKPIEPTLFETIPVSPNNQSYTPIIRGQSLQDPASQLPPLTVTFYDSVACLGKVGEGTPSEFATTGVILNLSLNAVSSIYARANDAAGNKSNCTFLLNYTHNALKPGVPLFLSTTPQAPSYSRNISIKGSFYASSDFMNKVAVSIYTDSSCTQLLTTGTPSQFTSTGIPFLAADNTFINLYGDSTNEVGTKSNCALLTPFRHFDLPPADLAATQNSNGSVYLTWTPDILSTPTIYYTIERSLNSQGPFTIIANSITSNNFTDLNITEGKTYYYRVYASNLTGRSQYTSLVSLTITSSAPMAINSLTATPSDHRVSLSWSGFSENLHYSVFRSNQRGGPYILLKHKLSGNQYVDSSVSNNVTYYYIVKGENPSGLSVESNEVSTTPRATPSAPSNFNVELIRSMTECSGASGMIFTWTPTNYYSSFNLYHPNATYPSTLNPQQVVCNLPNGGDNYFYVLTKWGDFYSVPSDVIGIYNTTGTNLTVNSGDGSNYLNWTVSASPVYTGNPSNEFDIYRSNSFYGPFTKIVNGTTATNFLDTNVTNGSSYFYYVQGYIMNGATKVYLGWPSMVLSGSPQNLPVSPTNLKLTYDEKADNVILNWISPSHYNSFRLYHAQNFAGPYSSVGTSTINQLTAAFKTTGMNYYKVVAVWGSTESSESNIVSFRYDQINSLVVSVDTTNVTLDWGDITGASNYSVYRSTDYFNNYNLINNVSVSNYIDTTALAGVGYYYKIVANYPDTSSGPSSNIVSAMLDGTLIPNSISADVQSLTQIEFHWSPIKNASIYRILASTTVNGTYTQITTSTSPSKIVTSLAPLAEHFIKVRATVSSVNYTSNPISVKTIIEPLAPNVSAGNNSVIVTWIPEIGILDYDIQRSTDLTNFTTIATNQTAFTYVDSTAMNGQIYYYRLVGDYGTLGTKISFPSLAVVPGVVPSAPTNLVATEGSTNSEVLLSWGKIDGVVNYKVYSATTSGGPYLTALFTTNVNSNVQVSGLVPDSTYYFVVRALLGEVESSNSNEIAFVPGTPNPAPSVANNGGTSVNVSWASVVGASLYNIYRSENSKNFTLLATGIAATNYNDVVPDPLKTYYYQYQPINAAGAKMPMSNVSNPITLGIGQLPPQNLLAYATNGSSIYLSWTAAPAATSYKILRSVTSGGPYTEIQSVSSAVLDATDTTVVNGQTYYYVVRAMNNSGVESTNSNQIGIQLTGSPQNLMAINVSNGVQLSWDAFAGASEYVVKRAEKSGGPYGEIARSGSNNYLDSEIISDMAYYYVVEAVLGSGVVSEQSAEVIINTNGKIKLQVPIELIDRKIASINAADLTFNRSMTSLDTDYYDGVGTYAFIINAKNEDSSNRIVSLVDSNDVVKATIVVPGSTLVGTWFTQSFTPNSGSDFYRIKIEKTTNNSELVVYNAKMLINQVNATKTRIYIPLMSSNDNETYEDINGELFITNNETYQDIPSRMTYVKDTSHFDKIVSYNAWEVEALVATSNSAQGSLALKNLTESQIVTKSETVFESGSIQMAKVSIDNDDNDFNSSNEGDYFALMLKCVSSCQTGYVKLYKAGLWVELEDLTKAQVYFRITNAQSSTSANTDYINERSKLNLSAYSNLKIRWQVELTDSPTSEAQISLKSTSSNSGSSGLVSVAGTDLSFNSDNRSIIKSSEIATLVDNENVITSLSPLSGDVQLHNSQIIIQCSKP